jgi:ABC-type Fe3+ transport system substrate-binding protein
MLNELGRYAHAGRLLSIGIFLVPTLLIAPGTTAAEWSPALQEVIAKATQEAELTLSTPGNLVGGSEGARAIDHGIKSMFGVDLKVTWGPSPSLAQMAAKLHQERQAGQPASTDLYVGGAAYIGPLVDADLFTKVTWLRLWPERIRPELVEADGQALKYETFLPGILYNISAAPWVKSTKTMEDLLKPKYKGLYATTPYLAGFDALLRADGWGKAKTTEYVRRMSENVSGYLPCSGTARIASGEVPALVFDCTGSYQNLPQYKGIIDSHIVSDAALKYYMYMTVPRNARHPNASILAALYLSSPEGQRDVALGLDGIDLDLYQGSWSHNRVAELEKEGVKFQSITIDWWNRQSGIADDLNELVKIVQRK